MSLKENEKIEFKKTTSEIKQGLISLCAMLNKSGDGVLYFGIKNDGTAFSLQIGKDTTRDISIEIRNHIKPIVTPIIQVVKYNDVDVIKVEVTGNEKPYSAYGRYYIRSDDEDYEMTSNQLEKIFKDKDITYSKWEQTLTEYDENEIDENALITYINKANELNRLNYIYKDSVDALTKLGLMNNGKLNNAGYYLFSKNKPLMIKEAIYATEEKITFIDNRVFNGNIFECINEEIEYINKGMNWNAKVIGLERVEKPEVPIEAIREVVVNSFAHMKVNKASYNQIEISPKTIKIYNPGELVEGKDPKDFASGTIASQIRNPLIAVILYRVKLIEAFGSGFRRIFQLCDKYNIKYRYYNNGVGFNFEFERNQTNLLKVSNDILDDSLKDILSINEQRIYNLLRDKGTIKTINEIAILLNLSTITVQRAFNKMTELKLVERIGTKKKGYWVIVER